MEFIKNIEKDFALSNEYKILDNIIPKNKKIDVLLKIKDLDINGITFQVSSIKNIDLIVEDCVLYIVKKLEKDFNKTVKIAKKVLKAWEKRPEDFIRSLKHNHKEIYTNKNLLNSNEYHSSTYVFLGNTTLHFECEFATGCGSDTYYQKEYFQNILKTSDDWLEKTIKTIKSSAFKTKIKNTILREKFDMNYQEVLKYISIPKVKEKKLEMNPFPIQFNGEQLNNLLHHIDDGCDIDWALVREVEKESNMDISLLVGWSITIETKGEMHHDSQVLENILTFWSPDGDDYSVTSFHSAMTGWDFEKDKIIELC